MKERPILFSGPMVRAILEGWKTQTRRVVKPVDLGERLEEHPRGSGIFREREFDREECIIRKNVCPYGQPGDRLWVRETCFPVHKWKHAPQFAAVEPDWLYRADYDYRNAQLKPKIIGCHKWTPSILMPRVASRITLEVVAVRVERLNAITRGDAMAEGCPFPNMAKGPDPREWYRQLWDEINGAGAWAENPWVWVVEFKREVRP